MFAVPPALSATGPRAFTMKTGSRRHALDTLLDSSHVVLMTEVRARSQPVQGDRCDVCRTGSPLWHGACMQPEYGTLLVVRAVPCPAAPTGGGC